MGRYPIKAIISMFAPNTKQSFPLPLYPRPAGFVCLPLQQCFYRPGELLRLVTHQQVGRLCDFHAAEG